MIVRRSRAVTIAVGLGLMYGALLVAVVLVQRTSEPDDRLVAALAGVGGLAIVAAMAGFLLLERRL